MTYLAKIYQKIVGFLKYNSEEVREILVPSAMLGLSILSIFVLKFTPSIEFIQNHPHFDLIWEIEVLLLLLSIATR